MKERFSKKVWMLALFGLALVIFVPGCAHQSEFTGHYDQCMQDLKMQRWEVHPGGYQARGYCRLYAQREMRGKRDAIQR